MWSYFHGEEWEFELDLIVMVMKSFDVILIVNWYSVYKDVIYCFLKTSTIEIPNKEFDICGITKVNAFVESFVAFLDDRDGEKGGSPLMSNDVTCEFANVFSKVLGLPLVNGVDFIIELVPRTTMISYTSYRVASKEMHEQRVHLDELLEHGFMKERHSL